MWPFAKLLNGFGSHRYLYSPILLDSQEQNHNLSTRCSCHAGDASPVTTIVPQVTGLRQWNGDADGYQLSCILVPAAGAASVTTIPQQTLLLRRCTMEMQRTRILRCLRNARFFANKVQPQLPSQVHAASAGGTLLTRNVGFLR